jgi:eukaryotic-like serine/threonine-protein kinase
LETRNFAAADTFVGDAGALIAVTGSAYDSVHEKILRAVLARATGDPSAAVMHAFDARQAAEAQAYVAYHFYAMGVEAAARVDIGESHTGILLATTAMGAIETIQGSEYGLETRALCCEALENAGSPQATELRRRMLAYVRQLADTIRDPELRAMFARRPLVARQLATPEAAALGMTAEAIAAPRPDDVMLGGPAGSTAPPLGLAELEGTSPIAPPVQERPYPVSDVPLGDSE